jgi:hypothetical protein
VRRFTSVLCFAALGLLARGEAYAQSDEVQAVRSYRTSHEAEIVEELVEFLSLPNIAADIPAIRRNAEAIIEMMAPASGDGWTAVRLRRAERARGDTDDLVLCPLRRPGGGPQSLGRTRPVRAGAARWCAGGGRPDHRIPNRRGIRARLARFRALCLGRQVTYRRSDGRPRCNACRGLESYLEPQVHLRGRRGGGITESRCHCPRVRQPAGRPIPRAYRR